MTLDASNTSFETRYTYGGEEFILVEFAEGMDLKINLLVQEIVRNVEQRNIDGIVDVCPANVSYLLRFDPDVVAGDHLIALLEEIENEHAGHELAPFVTRIVDVPVLFQDPWTYEVLMKFRDRVQDPSLTDIEYLAKANGLDGPEALIAELTSTPSMCTMTGFVPGVVWSHQMVVRERQLQGPKYLWPRTETPDRAFALGGAFPAIYPAPSAGGYPIIGRVAPPVYDPQHRLPDFQDTSALVTLGDIYNYRPIDRDEYDQIQDEVEAGTFSYRIRPVEFEPTVFFADPDQYCKDLVEVLYR